MLVILRCSSLLSKLPTLRFEETFFAPVTETPGGRLIESQKARSREYVQEGANRGHQPEWPKSSVSLADGYMRKKAKAWLRPAVSGSVIGTPSLKPGQAQGTCEGEAFQ